MNSLAAREFLGATPQLPGTSHGIGPAADGAFLAFLAAEAGTDLAPSQPGSIATGDAPLPATLPDAAGPPRIGIATAGAVPKAATQTGEVLAQGFSAPKSSVHTEIAQPAQRPRPVPEAFPAKGGAESPDQMAMPAAWPSWAMPLAQPHAGTAATSAASGETSTAGVSSSGKQVPQPPLPASAHPVFAARSSAESLQPHQPAPPAADTDIAPSPLPAATSATPPPDPKRVTSADGEAMVTPKTTHIMQPAPDFSGRSAKLQTSPPTFSPEASLPLVGYHPSRRHGPQVPPPAVQQAAPSPTPAAAPSALVFAAPPPGQLLQPGAQLPETPPFRAATTPEHAAAPAYLPPRLWADPQPAGSTAAYDIQGRASSPAAAGADATAASGVEEGRGHGSGFQVLSASASRADRLAPQHDNPALSDAAQGVGRMPPQTAGRVAQLGAFAVPPAPQTGAEAGERAARTAFTPMPDGLGGASGTVAGEPPGQAPRSGPAQAPLLSTAQAAAWQASAEAATAPEPAARAAQPEAEAGHAPSPVAGPQGQQQPRGPRRAEALVGAAPLGSSAPDPAATTLHSDPPMLSTASAQGDRLMAAAPAAQGQGTDLSASALRQVAELVAQRADRPVELTLAPEELGRVRLTLATTEQGVTVSVQAERPETLELFRRNIDHLARDFRELGYSNIAFSFGDRPQEQGQPDKPQAQAGAEVENPRHAQQVAPAAALTQQLPKVPGTGGLDLRL